MRNPGEDPDMLRFGFVIVDPSKHGKGYGKAMLQLGLVYAKQVYGASRASLGVFENNEAAWRCYRAVGFEDVKLPETEHYWINEEDWLCRELTIDLEKTHNSEQYDQA